VPPHLLPPTDFFFFCFPVNTLCLLKPAYRQNPPFVWYVLPTFILFFLLFRKTHFLYIPEKSRPEKIVCKCVLISFLGKISEQDTFYVPSLLDGISLYHVLDIYLCVYIPTKTVCAWNLSKRKPKAAKSKPLYDILPYILSLTHLYTLYTHRWIQLPQSRSTIQARILILLNTNLYTMLYVGHCIMGIILAGSRSSAGACVTG